MGNTPPKEVLPQHEENSAVEIVNYEVIYSTASCPIPTKSNILKSTDNPIYASIDHLNAIPTSNVATSSTENIQELPVNSLPTSPNKLDRNTGLTSPNVLDCIAGSTSLNVLDCTTGLTSPNGLDCTTGSTTPNRLDCIDGSTTPNRLDCTTSPKILDCTTGEVYSAVVRENGEKVTIHVERPLVTIEEENIYESPMCKEPPPKPLRPDL